MILKVYDLFDTCNSGGWITKGTTQYKLVDGTLYFQCSDGKEDWRRNFAFPAVPYKHMKNKFLVHAGFLSAWKEVRDDIAHLEFNRIVGYSHGAALALLACEDRAYNGVNVPTFVFGCPRTFFMPPSRIRALLARVKRYTSKGDIVTKLPPAIFGFRHVGENNILKGKVKKGEDSWLVFFSRHSPSVYRQRLAGL